MPNLINSILYSEMGTLLKDRDSFLMVQINGLEAEEAHSLRGKLHEQGMRMQVIKNRVAALAMKELGLEEIKSDMEGMSALVFGDEEGAAISAAKTIEEQFKKTKKGKKKKVLVQAALLDGEVLGKDRALALHTMPDKDTLRSMLIGTIQAPMRGLAAVLAAPGVSLARGLKARADGEGNDSQDEGNDSQD